jgi:acyl-CoA hydrolase
MKRINSPEEAINASNLKPGTVVYSAGNAATPQKLLAQIAADESIKKIAIYGIYLLGDIIKPLFTEECCHRITHRVIFNSDITREAVNKGWAKYHPMHLSEIPKYALQFEGIDVVLLTVSGPDPGGNYSLGTTVEGVYAAIKSARRKGGLVIAERNAQMPFVLGTTIPREYIDYILYTDYKLPASPIHEPDDRARKIGEIIAAMYVEDGTGKTPGSTLQYGLGEVPEAVTDAIIKKGVGDLAIHTELFADGMIKLIQKGVVTNRWKKGESFSVSSIFLAKNQENYDWLDYNSSVQSRPTNITNSVFEIAQYPKIVTINSAIGVDLFGNIWADSLDAHKIYGGVGGQSDFIRAAQFSEGGVAIIAMKSTTNDGRSKILERCPAGITTTAIPADQVIIVTEHGAFDPRMLSLGERAVGISHLANPDETKKLMDAIYKDKAFHKPDLTLFKGIPGFTPYEKAIEKL